MAPRFAAGLADLAEERQLSVAADRIGLAAMRCAALLARLAVAGAPVDRSGAGVVVEVYPAAALKQWGLTFRGTRAPPTAPSATSSSTR